jgi:hypothetical protein
VLGPLQRHRQPEQFQAVALDYSLDHFFVDDWQLSSERVPNLLSQ